jgi:putative peptidoglycan lipid II flippase
MIKKLFSGQINSITIAALLVALSSLVSRFLGIFRDRILAGEFGAGDTLDIYYAAFRIPDLVFNLLVLGALSAGFIPIFTNLLKNPLAKVRDVFSREKNKEAWQLTNNILNILGLSLLVLAGVGVIFAPLLMKLVAPGFSEGKQVLTVALTRIMFLSPIFLGISSVLGGVLQSFKRFFIYSLAPIMYNIGIIIGALYFVPIYGIYGLAWGVVLGAFLHMLIQLPMIIKLGFRYKARFNYKDKNVRKIGRMMVPRTMSLGIVQINLLVITVIASTLKSGSLAVFNFANNLQYFPIGIFGISFAVAAFPTLSAIAFNKKKLVENFSHTLRQILFFVVPSTVLILTLRAQIIRVILGTGQFDWEDTILTMDTLGFFAISLFAQATIPLLIRMFYARHDSKRPFYIGLIAAIANVFLSLWLARNMGVAGLALAFSAANIINFIILWIVLRVEIGNMDETRILYSVVKFSIAALACGITVQGMKLVVWQFVDMTKTLGVFTQGAVAGISGIIVFIIISWLLKSEELFNFWNGVKRRLLYRKVETGDQGEARGI